MKAYKCDICGKYVDDVYVNDDDTFDIFPMDAEHLGLKAEHINIRDMCRDCFEDIKDFIVEKYMRQFKEQK